MSDLKNWEAFINENDKSNLTISSYKTDIIQFMDYIQKEPEELTKDDINNYKKYLLENKLSIKSINRKLVAIKNFINYLVNEENRSITLEIKQEKIQRQEYLDEMLTKEDFDALVAVAERERDYRALALFYGLFLTGMRVSELLQLKVSDVRNDTISIKGKGSKYREVFVPERLRNIFRQYLAHRIPRETPFLFTSQTGKSGVINRITVNSIIKKYAKLSGVTLTKAHAHNFRHLYCMSLIEKGISIDTVADLAGHSDINTTRIYTRKTKNQLLDTINDL